MITICFDDGYESTYTKAFPILERHNFPATINVITDSVGQGGYASLDQLKELEKAGWEIGSHTISHPSLTEISTFKAFYEVYQSRRTLESWKFDVNSFAVPYGDANDEVWELIEQEYEMSRGSEVGLNYKPFPHHQLRSIFPVADTKLEDVKEWIDRAVNEKAWLIITFHRIGETGKYNNSEEFLEKICQYIENKGKVKVFRK